MLYSKLVSAAAMSALATSVAAGSIDRPWNVRHAHPMPGSSAGQIDESVFEKRANGTGGNKELLASNIQVASEKTGENAKDSDPGQAASNTDNANFINNCSGQDLTNGLQKEGGSCNGITMGQIPSTDAMTSSIITFPSPGQDLAPDQDFNVKVQMANLAAGSFTNPDVTYYAAPQALDDSGTIIGHTHVTVQDLGGTLAPDQPPDAKVTAFFLGIDNDGNGAGLLQAAVTGGLKPGFYRVCTMASSSNHQPVLMPIAQRGAQDDCTKFTVGQGNNATAKRDTYNPANREALYDRTKRFAAREWIA